MLHEIKTGAICFDAQLRRGQVVALDDEHNEVQLQFERRGNVPLAEFMEEYMVVCDLSSLHSLLNGGPLPIFREGKNLQRDFESCIVSGKPLAEGVLKAILVPNVMNEAHYNMQVLGVRDRFMTASKKEDEQAVSEIRWDESRTVLELSERLKKVATLDVEGECNWDNVERILRNGKDRAEATERFALALALILKNGNAADRERLYSLADSLADAVVWSDFNTCIEVSNKIPGKLAPLWFEYTARAVGTGYLVKLAIKLPYRLWNPIEHILLRLILLLIFQ